MKQYKGAIFDLDGTLLDSMRVWDDIDVAFLKKRGLEVPPDYQEAITPLGFLGGCPLHDQTVRLSGNAGRTDSGVASDGGRRLYV